ncbi:MAG: SMC-Scp complex subunit ScpB [bacterium]|nr:SMC-Scp complex subunit ScpB [bacterium]
MNLDAQLEAVLFYTGEEISFKDAAKLLSCTENEVKTACDALESRLCGGIVVVRNEQKIQIATAPGASELVARIRHHELSRDLSKPALETIAIIAYRQSVQKSEIDHIRGVNSATILRNLLVRGLITKTEDTDTRGYLYAPSLELLQYLGITSVRELPDFDDATRRIAEFTEKHDAGF